MHSTRITMGRGVASTHHGQQRILKRLPDLISYIQKAVKAGTYRTTEEIRDMNKKLEENPTDMKRLRWNLQRGSKIQDYPLEYEIMSLNPPVAFKPLMPVKHRRKMINQYIQKSRPTDRLARNFLNRHQEHERAAGPASSEEYYRKLLGVNRVPRVDSAMGQKSAVLNKAYAFALKQYEVMRAEDLSEKDALERVEELLKEDDKTERHASRATADDLSQKRTELVHSKQQSKPTNVPDTAKLLFPGGKSAQPEDMDDDSYLSLLYSSNQRGFEGMISWTYRLQAVPYAQWTVGASVALDHWIAKRVLSLSEETWLALLEGDDPSLMSRGRDIVMARHALFPETMEDGDEEEEIDQGEDIQDAEKKVEDEIDQLLATLGGWNKDDKNGKKWKFGDDDDDDAGDAGKRDDTVFQLTNQLQEWRARNVETVYEKWSSEEQDQFTVSNRLSQINVLLGARGFCLPFGSLMFFSSFCNRFGSKSTLLRLHQHRHVAMWTLKARARPYLRPLHKQRKTRSNSGKASAMRLRQKYSCNACWTLVHQRMRRKVNVSFGNSRMNNSWTSLSISVQFEKLPMNTRQRVIVRNS
jgi:hypothetical protein